ncbi:putative KRI1 protein [Blattamonas nauphoetae]|uniref:KRI1 protein n=1 Tax=Blattamonas nauphoetae TaxID=2049346 RepID=A0ABQ9Y9Y6_9EUKA|nr:putative KRI1 protein [Blattamonas nauphoetae]
MDLFDGIDDVKPSFTLNQSAARKFTEKKRHEELSRAKDLGLMDSDGEEEEEEEEDDSVDPDVDAQFFDLLQRIRTKDPSVYDPEVKFFQETSAKPSKKKEKSKPLTVGQYYRSDTFIGDNMKQVDEGLDIHDDEDSEKDFRTLPDTHPSKLVYDEKQQQLRNTLLSALNASVNEQDGDDDGDFLVKKTAESVEDSNEGSYLQKLEEREKELKAKGIIRFTTKDLIAQPLDETDRELFSFTLNQGWKKHQDKPQRSDSSQAESESELSSEEEEIDRQEEFEKKYNFRFEEPYGLEMQTNQRGPVEGSVRRIESKRKRERELEKERRELRETQLREETKRMKALLKEEKESKLNQIKSIAGIEEFDKSILEEDFDEAKFDAMMDKLFNDTYYTKSDEEFERQMELERGGDSDDSEEAKEEEPIKKKKRTHSEKDDIFDEIMKENKKNARKRAKELLDQQTRDKLEITKKELKDLMKKNPDELDFEDVIAGGLKTRFKYRKVKPNNYKLSLEDILNKDEEILNQRVPLKYVTAPYRESDEPPKRRRSKRDRERKKRQAERLLATKSGQK